MLVESQSRWRINVAIPDYQSLMLPLLIYASDGNEHSLRDAIEALAMKFSLTPDERREVLPSGRQATFDNRVGWSRTYLKKAGLLTSPNPPLAEMHLILPHGSTAKSS
jgi:restriction system protein